MLESDAADRSWPGEWWEGELGVGGGLGGGSSGWAPLPRRSA